MTSRIDRRFASLRKEGRAALVTFITAGDPDYDTSVAILDALNAFDGPVFEIHISNVHKREAFRHHSYVSSRADGVIAGFGTQGYTLALQRLARLIDETAAKSG